MKKIKVDGYISQQYFNTPLLLELEKAKVISNYLEKRIMGVEIGDDEYPEKEKQLYQNVNGVAVIQLIGTLVHRGAFMNAMSGLESYQDLKNKIYEASIDPAVKSILLDIDSGGGEVEGNFELARFVRKINDEVKPVVAISNGSAYSGAYSIGASAGEFYVTETGGVGSIGVIIQHLDYSKFNEMNGVKVTNIVAGERKAEGSSDFPLTRSAKDFLQNEANRIADIFIKHVSDMRRISENDIRNTQASLLFGQDAVNMGLVDGILSFDELLDQMVKVNYDQNDIQPKGADAMQFFRKDKKIETDTVKTDDQTITTPDEKETPAEEVLPEGDAPKSDDVKTETPIDADPAEVVQMCVDAGMAEKAPEFIRQKISIEDLKSKIDFKNQVEVLCKIAKKDNLVDEYINGGLTIKQIQDDLLSKLASKDEISGTISVDVAKKELENTGKQINVILDDVEKRFKNKGV